MSSEGKVDFRVTGVIEGQGPISNVATNLADMAAEAKMNIDGKSVRPEEVITKRLYLSENIQVGGEGAFVTIGDGTITGQMLVSTEAIITSGVQIGNGLVTATKVDIAELSSISANLGTITAGTINTNNVTIGAGGSGAPTTGVGITATRIVGTVDGVTKLDIDTEAGTYYFKGEVVADKVTIVSNANNSVVFGTSITIDGELIMKASNTDGRIRFDGASGTRYLDYDETYATWGASVLALVNGGSGSVGMFQGGSVFADVPHIDIEGGDIVITNYASGGDYGTTRGIILSIGTAAGNYFYLNRGATTVMYFNGNSSNVTFAGKITCLGFDNGGAVMDTGALYSVGSVKGVHKTTAAKGSLYKADTSFSFYAASTSGGAVNKHHTVTFVDGLITSWSVV